jgi:hypothetical protein
VRRLCSGLVRFAPTALILGAVLWTASGSGFAAAVSPVVAPAIAPAIAPAVAPVRELKIRGMTLSTPRGSAEWGKDAVVPTISDLRGLGVNWIAIHPYARIEPNGEVRWRGSFTEAPDWLRRPIQEAHLQGVKILIKPHLAHWGNFSWRGAIEFDSEQKWERFFRSYREWIEAMAAFSEGADAFAVGTELDRTLGHEAQWRDVIAAVRARYDGPLTYAANWTDYENVPFWDALDAIGIQAYFPVLPASATADGRLPAAAEFDSGWVRIMERLRAYGQAQDRTVVFTELGYNRSAKAPHEPWDFDVGGTNAEALQELCMRAALRAIEAESAVVGSFLWKWFPGDARPRNFEMSSPAMRRVIREHWAAPAAGDAR